MYFTLYIPCIHYVYITYIMHVFFIRYKCSVIDTKTQLQINFLTNPLYYLLLLNYIAIMKPKFLCAVLNLPRFQSQQASRFEATEAFPGLFRTGLSPGRINAVGG